MDMSWKFKKKSDSQAFVKKAGTWTGVIAVINSLNVLVWLNNRKIRTIQIQYRYTHVILKLSYLNNIQVQCMILPQYDIHPSTQVHNHHFYRTPVHCTNQQQP